jgi:hypothetical protein
MFAVLFSSWFFLLSPPTVSANEENAPEVFARRLSHGMKAIEAHHFKSPAQASMTRWAVRGLYKAAKFPVPPEFEKRLEALAGADPKERQRLLKDARFNLRQVKELNEGKDIGICLDAIFAVLEPSSPGEVRSSYIRPEDIPPCRGDGRFQSVGIGLRLEIDENSGYLRVATPVWKSPAHRAGLRAGDLILSITVSHAPDGEPLPAPIAVPTKGLSLEEAIRLILGPEDTPVTLRVLPARPPTNG